MTKVDMLNQATYTIMKIYNVYSSIKYFTQFKQQKLVSKNHELKNLSNEKCFIIGNGPSLKEIDLTKISGYDTFTVNFFHKHNENLLDYSSYHVMIDGSFYTEKNIDYLLKLYQKSSNTKFIFSTKGYELIKDKIKDSSRIYCINQGLIQYENFLRLDMTKNMTASVNVVLASIQCAIFMGYKTIYLLGCDFNSYATMKPTHFYEKSEQERIVPIGVDLQWSSMAHYHHYALASYAIANGIKISNATHNSLIDAYERLEFDSLI